MFIKPEAQPANQVIKHSFVTGSDIGSAFVLVILNLRLELIIVACHFAVQLSD